MTSGAVTPSQADLLAVVNTDSAIKALISSGDFTAQRGAAVSQVIKGYSRTQARYSAVKFALELLTSTGVLTHAQAEDVRAQLALTGKRAKDPRLSDRSDPRDAQRS